MTSTPADFLAGSTIYGHQEARETLAALRSHTLLFVGPERVGKRRVAKWYAQLLNCARAQQEGSPSPCESCESCRLFRADMHPDYREVAPQSDTKSGKQSRRLQIRIGDLVPREGGAEQPLSRWLEARPRYQKRVAVIDGAQVLNTAAANAFLKFLEEPPSYAVVIMIAPSVTQVLPTLVSRSVVVRFGAVTVAPPVPPELAGLEDYPGARLGRIGEQLSAAEQPETFTAQREVVRRYLQALPKTLEEALDAADALEKAWQAAPEAIFNLLRSSLAADPLSTLSTAPATLDALEACAAAIGSYASPPLAVQHLTLELRQIQNPQT